LRTQKLNANVNFYSTTWGNRWESEGVTLDGGTDGVAVFSGIENLHTGVEVELTYKPIQALKVRGAGSFGNWVYKDNVTASVFDDNQAKIGETTLFLKDVKVGDAAQTTANIGLDYNFWGPLSVDLSWLYFGNLFADFSATDSDFFNEDNKGAVRLPNYNLMDFGLTFNKALSNGQVVTFRANVNNLLDTEYISESKTNIHPGDGETDLYNGVSKSNFVWFGFGRTWNVSLKYQF